MSLTLMVTGNTIPNIGGQYQMGAPFTMVIRMPPLRLVHTFSFFSPPHQNTPISGISHQMLVFHLVPKKRSLDWLLSEGQLYTWLECQTVPADPVNIFNLCLPSFTAKRVIGVMLLALPSSIGPRIMQAELCRTKGTSSKRSISHASRNPWQHL